MDPKTLEKPANARRAWPYALIGAAVGTGIGVLLAPKTGKETRRELGEWIKERRSKTKAALAR